MTVAQIDATMSSRELTEWMLYYSFEPFGEARQDYRTALQCSIAANVAGSKAKPTDFIQPFDPVEHIKTREAEADPDGFTMAQRKQMTLLKAFGGGIKNGGE